MLSPSPVAAPAAPPATASSVDLAAELQKLPMQNATALRVLALLDDPDVLIADLGRLIATDVTLATKVLKLANSAFFGRRNEVTALDKAIVSVGLSTVRTFTLAAAFDLFNDKGAPLPEDFWRHAVATAAGSSVVAKHVRVSPGDAFSAGLLHDLGMALLYRIDPARYDRACAGAPDGPERCAAEVEAFGLDHQQAAGLALGAVKFPKVLLDAITEHHEPVRRKRLGKPELAAIVAVGERLGALLATDEEDPMLTPLLELIGVEAPLARLRDEVLATSDDVAAFSLA